MPRSALILLTLALVGCNGNGTTEEPEPSPKPAPEISSFVASASSISQQSSVTLLAAFSNGSGQIDNGVGAVTSNNAISVSPAASTTYTLTVTNDVGDSVSASVDVTVEPRPEISGFTASPSSIKEGDSATLLPAFSNGSGEIDNSVGAVNSNEAMSVSPAASTTYTLTVTNGAGDSVSASVDVIVEPSPIAIEIRSPENEQLAGDELFVAATVMSEFDIAAVTAEVQGRNGPLEFQEEWNRFSGELSLAGLPSGSQVVTVTVEDVMGNARLQQRSFVLNRPPIFTVTEPLDYSVARPVLPAEASCSDDMGDCLIRIWWAENTDGHELASAESELSQMLDLSEFEGRGIDLEMWAEDSEGQRSAIIRKVFVESSERLTNERQFPTLVIDFDGQRALLERTSDQDSEVTIVDVESGSETVVEVPENFDIERAFLSPVGAIYSGLEGGSVFPLQTAIYDWNNSVLMELGPGGGLELAGDYAIWSDGSDLRRRQLSTMASLLVNDTDAISEYSVAGNGVVAFSRKPDGEMHYQVLIFDSGVYTSLTADIGSDSRSPATDGQGVVYRKTAAAGHRIAFHDGTTEFILTDFRDEAPDPDRAFPGRDFAIAGGWVAFTDLGNLGQTHVWTRDPSGVLLQRTAFGTDSWIETLAPNGEVMVVTREKRYLSLPGGEFVEIGWRWPPQDGLAIKIGDTWYVSIGRSVFEVQ